MGMLWVDVDVDSVFDAIEEPRDLLGMPCFQTSRLTPTGEGNGEMSRSASSRGEPMADPGDNEPAAECNAARILGVRCGMLVVEVLWRKRESDSGGTGN